VDTQRKIILGAWAGAAVLGLTLILLTRAKSANDKDLATAITGTWRGVGFDEMDQFRDDGTVTVQGSGKAGILKYKVLDPHRLQFSSEGEPPHLYKGVSIKGDELTMTSATGGETIRYNRIKSPSASALDGEKLASPSPLPSDQPRQIEKPADRPTVSKATNLKTAILGKWQLAGQKETNEWLADGTVIIKNNQGETFTFSYKILNSNVMLIPEGESPATADMLDVEIDGDILSLTTPTRDGPATDNFVRVNAHGAPAQVSPPKIPASLDRSALLGRWKSKDGDNVLVFAQDGTFQFGEDKGQWQVVGGQVVAKDANGPTIWKMMLSSDGQQLSGHFSTMVRPDMGRAGRITLTR